MKKIIPLIAVILLTFGYCLSSSAQTKTATKTTSSAKTKMFAIDTEKSTLTWLGKKVVGQHNGNVKIQSGTLNVKNGVLAGGTFIIDMNSITCEDITNEDYNKKLIGHLKDADFFNVSAFPTATIKITKVLKLTKKVNTYNLTANLTIKGITKSISFPAILKKAGNGFEANAKITMDRTKWDIKYGSASFIEGLGDKAIQDEIEIGVNIVSK